MSSSPRPVTQFLAEVDQFFAIVKPDVAWMDISGVSGSLRSVDEEKKGLSSRRTASGAMRWPSRRTASSITKWPSRRTG